MNDALGDRMKQYEDAYRFKLPRKTNVVIRVDGRAFHTYTKNCKRPYDNDLMSDMDQTAMALCEQIQGAKFAYVQSDEISIWVNDCDDINTTAWFDNNLQKMASIAASIATAEFNLCRNMRKLDHLKEHDLKQMTPLECLCIINSGTLANFDARVWIIPAFTEVANYFKWRSDDCSRNSVQMLARSLYSHKELEGKKTTELKNLIKAKGSDWDALEAKYKNGRVVLKEKRPDSRIVKGEVINFERSVWVSKGVEDTSFAYFLHLTMLNTTKSYG